ncbi:MAG: helix-turn-helix transcriptional regulator [Elusimicrobiota bacterium]
MKKSRSVTYEQHLKRSLKDPGFRKVFAEPDDDIFLETAYQLITLRKKAGLTQAQLAKKLGVSQQAVGRLESMNYKGHSLATLQKIADVLHKKLRLQFV